MISTAADYDFVTGITNGEVLIDGHIMPYRDTNYVQSQSPATDNPLCLRGEDLCFLREGIYRRDQINSNPPHYTWAYNPKVDGYVVRSNIYLPLKTQYDQSGGTTGYNSGLFTTTTFPTKNPALGTAGDLRSAYSENLVTSSMMVSSGTDFYDGTRKPLRSDNMRKLFRDFALVKCQTRAPTYINNGLTTTFTKTGEVDAGDPSIHVSGDPDYYPPIPTNSSSNNYILLGERYYYEDNMYGWYCRARSYQRTGPSQMTLTWYQPSDFSRYATSTFTVVRLYTRCNGTYTNIYSLPSTERWVVVPSTLQGSTVYVSLSNLMSAATQYASDVGVLNQFFTRGRSIITSPPTSPIWGATIEVMCQNYYPIFTMPDLDYSYWNWQPQQAGN